MNQIFLRNPSVLSGWSLNWDRLIHFWRSPLTHPSWTWCFLKWIIYLWKFMPPLSLLRVELVSSCMKIASCILWGISLSSLHKTLMLPKSGSWLGFLVLFSYCRKIVGNFCPVFLYTFSYSSISFTNIHFVAVSPWNAVNNSSLIFYFWVCFWCNKDLTKDLIGFETCADPVTTEHSLHSKVKRKHQVQQGTPPMASSRSGSVAIQLPSAEDMEEFFRNIQFKNMSVVDQFWIIFEVKMRLLVQLSDWCNQGCSGFSRWYVRCLPFRTCFQEIWYIDEWVQIRGKCTQIS